VTRNTERMGRNEGIRGKMGIYEKHSKVSQKET
jgi:hypothetical protein